MNPKDDSGPAFPNPAASHEHFGTHGVYLGISERKYYAAEAMKVLLAQAVSNNDPGERGAAIFAAVESSFFIADLMVKEGAK